MIFVKIKNNLYPAIVNGRMVDENWDNRESKSITLEMDYITAATTFVDDVPWSIVQQDEIPIYDENGTQIDTELQEVVFDNNEFSLAGDITDHRDGTITAKMGKFTNEEYLLMEVLA